MVFCKILQISWLEGQLLASQGLLLVELLVGNFLPSNNKRLFMYREQEKEEMHTRFTVTTGDDMGVAPCSSV
jgi:hypothetical protein